MDMSGHKLEVIMDHKYFSRKLNEFKRLTNAKIFECPKKDCVSSFKSTLGLAYHMNTCGRTEEELEAFLIECEICQRKFTMPNMGWHRKTHEQQKQEDSEEEAAVKQISHPNSSKRKSAAKARLSFKKMADVKGKEGEGDDGWVDDTNVDSPDDEITDRGSSRIIDVPQDDFCSTAMKFLQYQDSETRAWDDPARNLDDPFLLMQDNKFHNIEHLEDYLPIHQESVEFKYVTDEGASSYHRLSWFEGETVISNNPVVPTASLHHTGGQVLSMSWHPSGKLLAVSIGHDYKEDINVFKVRTRKGCVQLYSCSTNGISLQLVIGVNWGYTTHLQWGSFWPDIVDSYDPSLKSCFDDIEIFCRIGYLAMNCEDSTVRIMAIRIEDLKLEPNYEYKPGLMVKVYTKTPEMCLELHESEVDEPIGHAVKFDWHEKNKFLVVGYASGTIAVYDLQTTSTLLVQILTQDNSDRIVVINPIWTFHGHRLCIKGIKFDPRDPRYFVSASHDRTMKMWDMYTRMERDAKRVGITLDLCWVRGWIHQMASFEAHVSYQSAMHNYIRAFQVGCPTGKPCSGGVFNSTSLDFYHGLTLQGTDDGTVSATYFDIFWRECDYERNRKKKNLVHLCTTKVDETTYRLIDTIDFSTKIKKLSKSAVFSKNFNEPEEENPVPFAINLEAKYGRRKLFDRTPDPNNRRDVVKWKKWVKECQANMKVLRSLEESEGPQVAFVEGDTDETITETVEKNPPTEKQNDSLRNTDDSVDKNNESVVAKKSKSSKESAIGETGETTKHSKKKSKGKGKKSGTDISLDNAEIPTAKNISKPASDKQTDKMDKSTECMAEQQPEDEASAEKQTTDEESISNTGNEKSAELEEFEKSLEAMINDDGINTLNTPAPKDGLVVVVDLKIPQEEPKIILSFVKERPNSSVPADTVQEQKIEEFVRFQPFIRINKVSFSPSGNLIAVGYRNGLISLMPGSFDKIFMC